MPAVLSARVRAERLGLTEEESGHVYEAVARLTRRAQGRHSPDAAIRNTGASCLRQTRLLQLAWRIYDSGDEGVQEAVSKSKKMRARIRTMLLEDPSLSAGELRDTLMAAGEWVCSSNSFGPHASAVRKELGIDGYTGTVVDQQKFDRARTAAGGAPRPPAPPPADQEKPPPPPAPPSKAGAARETADSRTSNGRAGAPALEEVSADVLQAYEDVSLSSYGSWSRWYGEHPVAVVRVLRLRRALGKPTPEEFVPLLEAVA